MFPLHRLRSGVVKAALVALVACAPATLPALCQTAPSGPEVYRSLKAFRLSGAAVPVSKWALKRDRAEMTFDGTLYLEESVGGRVCGAVFVGNGSFRAEPPKSAYERDNLRRLLKADAVESDFQTAVLRFTDDSLDGISKNAKEGTPIPTEVQKLAEEFEPRFVKETGANLSARLAISILNREAPGLFLGQFDKGKRHRFMFLFDPQARIPVATFGVNAGEKALIFAHNNNSNDNDIWMAFYSLEDYQRGRVEYSDVYDLVRFSRYVMQVDLREPKHLRLAAHMEGQCLAEGLRALPLSVSEGLDEYDNQRLKKAMRVKSVHLGEGTKLETAQEDWESGLTVFLDSPLRAKQPVQLTVELEGDFIYNTDSFSGGHYPLSNTTWYPRHGSLQRATFDVTFRHRKNLRVAASGDRIREDPDPEEKNGMLTEFRLDVPVPAFAFALAPFELHSETVKWKEGGALAVEFYSLPGSVRAIKEDFILAELSNSVQYFSAMFGRYPYHSFRATFHPFGFGQGLPTMLLIPATDRESKYTYSFIAHETSHQWWGDVVAWRSYRDQWLSEGFAEYSGVLYTALRDKSKSGLELVRDMRETLRMPPRTELGLGKGRLVDVGPIILGHRLSTRETRGAYTALIYSKGGLVLRMLHFLFTDPGTGKGDASFEMMSDFVKRYANGWASTDDFLEVANEHFARTPIAQKYGLRDLNWFFRQWVFLSTLPSYRLEYHYEDQPGGGVVLTGVLYQENLPEGENWIMPLPLVLHFGKDRIARGTVLANGPRTPISIKLPGKPDHVELDPDFWVLSEKTSTVMQR